MRLTTPLIASFMCQYEKEDYVGKYVPKAEAEKISSIVSNTFDNAFCSIQNFKGLTLFTVKSRNSRKVMYKQVVRDSDPNKTSITQYMEE